MGGAIHPLHEHFGGEFLIGVVVEFFSSFFVGEGLAAVGVFVNQVRTGANLHGGEGGEVFAGGGIDEADVAEAVGERAVGGRGGDVFEELEVGHFGGMA